MATNKEILTNAENIMSGIEDKIAEMTGTGDAIEALKEQITTGDIINKSTGKKVSGVTIPESILDAFAAPIVEKINLTSTDKYSKTKWAQEVMGQIANAVNNLDDINTGKYTITYDELPWTISGIGQISAKVTWGNYEATLTWENFSQKTLQNYFDTLKQLDKDLFKRFATKLTKETVPLLIKAIYVTQSNEVLEEVLGNTILKVTTKEKLKTEFKNYVKKFVPDNKELLKAISAYEKLGKKYNALVTALNTNKNIDSKAKDFLTAANSLEKSLGLTESALSEEYSFGLMYNEDETAVTVPIIWSVKEIKSTDYKSAGVIEIDASKRTTAIKISGTELANKISGGSKNDTLYGGKGNDTLNGNAGNDKLYGEADDDTLKGGDGKDTLYGGDNNDELYGEAGNDKLFGDAGNDTLEGGLGNDSLTGGDGADIFYYSDGDGTDTITDYTSNVDKIYLASGSISKVSMSGKIVTFKIGKGSIKVKDAKDKKITVIMPDKSESVYLNGKLVSNGGSSTTPGGGDDSGGKITGVTVTLSADTTGTFKLNDYNKTVTKKAVNIDAQAVKSYLYIHGDDKANAIWAPNKVYSGERGGYIYAGAGNDTIYCGKGNDTIYYCTDDDNETIYNFKTGDRIRINDGYPYSSKVKVENVTLNGKDVVVNLNSGNTITLKDAKDEEIYIDGYDVNGNGIFGKTFGKVSFSGNTVSLGSDYQGTFRISDYSTIAANVDASTVKNRLTIYGSDKANSIRGGKGGGDIYSGDGNDAIHCEDSTSYTYIYAGDGNDTIWAPNKVYSGDRGGDIYAGAGNDTIYCGKGNDTIYYCTDDDNETIYNFKTGDRIRINDGYPYSSKVKVENVTLNGKDVVVNLNSGNTITLKDAKDEEIYIDGYDVNGNNVGSKTFGKVSFSGNTVSLGSDYQGTFRISDYSTIAANVDASTVKNRLTIYGSDKANSIRGGKGGGDIYSGDGNDAIHCEDSTSYTYIYAGDGNDTIWAPNKVYSGDRGGDIYAGAGNDTIYCGKGNDTIYYCTDDDNETIYNFKTGDRIRINNGYYYASKVKVENVTLSGKDVIVNLDSGNTITIKDSKDEKIYIDGCYTDGKQVGTLNFSSSSADVATYDDVDELLSFADASSSDVSDLDSLMTELPTTNISVNEFLTGTADDSRNLLSDAVFATSSTKK